MGDDFTVIHATLRDVALREDGPQFWLRDLQHVLRQQFHHAGVGKTAMPQIGKVARCARFVPEDPRCVLTHWSPLAWVIGTRVDADCPHADPAGKMRRAGIAANEQVQTAQDHPEVCKSNRSAK